MPSPPRLLAVATFALALASPLAGRAAADEPPAAASAGPVPAPAADVSAVTSQVQAFYDQSSSFQADFTQEYLIKQYGQKKLSRGHVTFKKPGKMYWRYDEPQGNRVVSDGQKLRVYEQSNKQMYEQDVTALAVPGCARRSSPARGSSATPSISSSSTARR